MSWSILNSSPTSFTRSPFPFSFSSHRVRAESESEGSGDVVAGLPAIAMGLHPTTALLAPPGQALLLAASRRGQREVHARPPRGLGGSRGRRLPPLPRGGFFAVVVGAQPTMSSPRECVTPGAGGWSASTLALMGRIYDESPIFVRRLQGDGTHTREVQP